MGLFHCSLQKDHYCNSGEGWWLWPSRSQGLNWHDLHLAVRQWPQNFSTNLKGAIFVFKWWFFTHSFPPRHVTEWCINKRSWPDPFPVHFSSFTSNPSLTNPFSLFSPTLAIDTAFYKSYLPSTQTVHYWLKHWKHLAKKQAITSIFCLIPYNKLLIKVSLAYSFSKLHNVI